MGGKGDDASAYPKAELFGGSTPEQLKILRDFLPVAYFEPGYDAVKALLDTLPPSTDPGFVKQIGELESGMTAAHDIVGRRLNQHLLDNYKDCIDAMTLISSLNSKLDISAVAIRDAREVLERARMEICSRPNLFFIKIRKRDNLKQVLDILMTVESLGRKWNELESALAARSFMRVLELCQLPPEICGAEGGLQIVQAIREKLRATYDELSAKMDCAVRELCDDFVPDVYHQLLQAYDIQNRLDDVPAKIARALDDKMVLEWKRAAREPFVTRFERSCQIVKAVLEMHRRFASWHRMTDDFGRIKKPLEDAQPEIWRRGEENALEVLRACPIESMTFEQFEQVERTADGLVQYSEGLVVTSRMANALLDLSAQFFKFLHRQSLQSAQVALAQDDFSGIDADEIAPLEVECLRVRGGLSLEGCAHIQKPVSQSARAVLRVLRSYVEMIQKVPKIANEAFRGIRELVEFYVLGLFLAFTCGCPLRPVDVKEGKLNPTSVAQWIYEGQAEVLMRLLVRANEQLFSMPAREEIRPTWMAVQHQLPVAASGLAAIAWFLELAQPALEDVGEVGNRRRFFSDVVSGFVSGFAGFVLPFVVPGLVPIADLEKGMRAVRWTVGEPPDKPSPCCEAFKAICSDWSAGVAQFPEPLRKEAFGAFWRWTQFVLICSFAVEKCSKGGRALMEKNLEYLQDLFAEEATFRPDATWCGEYIRAYRKTPDEFKAWARENVRRYSHSWIGAIVETGLEADLARGPRKALREAVAEIFGVRPR